MLCALPKRSGPSLRLYVQWHLRTEARLWGVISQNRTSGQQSLAEPEDRETRGVTGVERWTAVGDFAGKLFGNVHR
jgi:hypothetical protein